MQGNLYKTRDKAREESSYATEDGQEECDRITEHKTSNHG
jgi:hypothetical protein